MHWPDVVTPRVARISTRWQTLARIAALVAGPWKKLTHAPWVMLKSPYHQQNRSTSEVALTPEPEARDTLKLRQTANAASRLRSIGLTSFAGGCAGPSSWTWPDGIAVASAWRSG